MEENTQIDLLVDIESTHLVQESTGKRFANYIIDLIIFYIQQVRLSYVGYAAQYLLMVSVLLVLRLFPGTTNGQKLM
ncbi:MAG: hypothetical protein J0I84_07690 [Terrimonas sp.]|nr:hypothetical protein [Terrimonas sp.]OJY87480.1 MAG: hypothetical protein BGP13_24620 [Sphingobacteriales bacterium 40-81]